MVAPVVPVTVPVKLSRFVPFVTVPLSVKAADVPWRTTGAARTLSFVAVADCTTDAPLARVMVLVVEPVRV